MIKNFFKTPPLRNLIIIFIIVGAIFLSEGLQKSIFPDMLGPGRFEKMGFPTPEFVANFVGVFETGCGILILLGFLTRFAALAMLINMNVAIVVTKIPIALGDSFGPFVLHNLRSYGFRSMAHEIQTILRYGYYHYFLLSKVPANGRRIEN